MTAILPFFQGTAFEPEVCQGLGEAFERACQSLHDVGQPDIVKEVIAKRIIELARCGERDPERLCEQALQGFGVMRKFV